MYIVRKYMYMEKQTQIETRISTDRSIAENGKTGTQQQVKQGDSEADKHAERQNDIMRNIQTTIETALGGHSMTDSDTENHSPA